MSAVSAMVMSSGYLHGRFLPHLGCGSCSRDSTGGCAVLLILESKGFGSILGSDLSNSNHRYGLTTIDQKDVNPFNNLTIHVSLLTISRLYSLS